MHPVHIVFNREKTKILHVFEWKSDAEKYAQTGGTAYDAYNDYLVESFVVLNSYEKALEIDQRNKVVESAHQKLQNAGLTDDEKRALGLK